MSNDLTKRNSGTGLSTAGDRPSVLNELIKSLPPEQQQKLAVKAAEALIEQEQKDLDAQRRFDGAGADMIRHVGLVNEHEKNKSDFTVTSKFQTASGETNVKVSKNNNTTVIVIAVVIAVIFFVMFSR